MDVKSIKDIQDLMTNHEGIEVTEEAAISLAAASKLSEQVEKGSTICIIVN